MRPPKKKIDLVSLVTIDTKFEFNDFVSVASKLKNNWCLLFKIDLKDHKSIIFNQDRKCSLISICLYLLLKKKLTSLFYFILPVIMGLGTVRKNNKQSIRQSRGLNHDKSRWQESEVRLSHNSATTRSKVVLYPQNWFDFKEPHFLSRYSWWIFASELPSTHCVFQLTPFAKNPLWLHGIPRHEFFRN